MSKKKRVFFESGSHQGNAVMNFRAFSNEEFSIYASAFHRAANSLVETIQKIRKDTDAIPIVYLYRHSLELYLKGIIVLGRKLMGLENSTKEIDKIFQTHNYDVLLPKIEEIFIHVGWTNDTEVEDFRNIQEIGKALKELVRIDPKGTAFRYPQVKSIPRHFAFNIYRFAESMNKLLELLDGACTGLDAMLDARNEAIEDMEQPEY